MTEDVAMNQEIRKWAGVEQEASHKFGADPLAEQVPGQHLWMMMAMYRVVDPALVAGGQVFLDLENLITIDGPGCFACEAMYTPEIASLPCPGEPA